MLKLFFYLSIKYLKIFFVIFIGLVLFYVGFDYLQESKGLPESANLRLLYLYYHSMFATDFLMPVSLVFAMIATKMMLIRSNELVALYSLGYTKWQVLRPFVIVSMVLTFIYIGAHATKYAYAAEFVSSIAKKGTVSRTTKDLFFKYKDYYIYFEKLYPVAKKAENITIFYQNRKDITEVIRTKEAFYRDNRWYIPSAQKLLKKSEIDFENKVIEIFRDKNIEILEGFKPEILDQIHQGKIHYSIIDAFKAITLLEAQNASADIVYTSLYTMTVYPFFAPALIIIIFFFVPTSARMLNVSLFSFLAILATLMGWGILFLFRRLTQGGVFTPELGIIAPILLLFIAAFVVWYKKAR